MNEDIKKSIITEEVLNELLQLLRSTDVNTTGTLINFSFFKSTTEDFENISLKSVRKVAI